MEKAYLIQAYVKNPQQFAKHLRKPFTVEDLQTPFFILLVGYTMAFLVFLMEKFVAAPDIVTFLWPTIQWIKQHTFRCQRGAKCVSTR